MSEVRQGSWRQLKESLEEYFRSRRSLVDQALDGYLQPREGLPESLREAMRYSLLAPGKRLRPLLVLLASLPALRGRVRAPLCAFVVSIGAGVVANALVVAGLARVHPRYQSRVIWLVPLAAAAVFISSRARRAPPSPPAPAPP